MKKFLMFLAIFFCAANAQAGCDIKGVVDETDGAVYYTKEHRLYRFVNTKSSVGGKNFCSENDAEKAGYKPAGKYFSDSTARVVECIENNENSNCGNYVMGIYKSLDIYEKVCGASDATRDQVLHAFLGKAKGNEKNLDIAKYYGTTNALMDAYPCTGSSRKIARN